MMTKKLVGGKPHGQAFDLERELAHSNAVR